MIDPEERVTARGAHASDVAAGDARGDDWTPGRGDAVAVYVLVHRRRSRAHARRAAVAAASLALAVAYAHGSTGLALAALAACPATYGIARGCAERRLRARLGVSAAMLSACVARYLASPMGAANAVLLARGDAQVR